MDVISKLIAATFNSPDDLSHFICILKNTRERIEPGDILDSNTPLIPMADES